jgi:hypothetical protein
MATTDLKLDQPGSLPKPGPIGRIARLSFGALCLWYVMELIMASSYLIDSDGQISTVLWNGILIGLFLVSYVINIGFSRAWKKRPALVSIGILLLIALIGFAVQGSFETLFLARAIWVWELYVFSHLGLAFIVSALIRSPGCEMRAFHHLYSHLTRIPTKEHYCPIGPLHPIDQWEARVTAQKKNPES